MTSELRPRNAPFSSNPWSEESRQVRNTGIHVFIDYLFIAFTSKLAFGPTDAPLLAGRAKLLAIAQIFISLSIVILLVPRAGDVL
jgi:hypothetical protein